MDPPDSVRMGTITSGGPGALLIDEATDALVTTSASDYVIPARGANEPPHAYIILVHLMQLDDLRPSPGAYNAPNENTLLGLTYTGLPPGAPVNVCSEVGIKVVFGEPVEYCRTMTTYRRMVALDHASLQMDGAAVDVKTTPSAGVTATIPSYVPASTFAVGPMTWDSGDDDLPGPH